MRTGMPTQVRSRTRRTRRGAGERTGWRRFGHGAGGGGVDVRPAAGRAQYRAGHPRAERRGIPCRSAADRSGTRTALCGVDAGNGGGDPGEPTYRPAEGVEPAAHRLDLVTRPTPGWATGDPAPWPAPGNQNGMAGPCDLRGWRKGAAPARSRTVRRKESGTRSRAGRWRKQGPGVGHQLAAEPRRPRRAPARHSPTGVTGRPGRSDPNSSCVGVIVKERRSPEIASSRMPSRPVRPDAATGSRSLRLRRRRPHSLDTFRRRSSLHTRAVIFGQRDPAHLAAGVADRAADHRQPASPETA